MIRTTSEKVAAKKALRRGGDVTDNGEDNDKGEAKAKKGTVTITPPNLQTAAFRIRGTAPYVQNKFSKREIDLIKAKQEAGSTSTKVKKRAPKEFQRAFEEATHRGPNGEYGIPATAFRCAMIDACRMAQFKMTMAKPSVFVLADCADVDDYTPMVLITKGKPKYFEATVRPQLGKMDIRVRPLWEPGWEATVRIQYDADQFTLTDVANLLHRAGLQIGVGEGRAFSKISNGCGWGFFTLIEE
jgi:hypothetical protein